MTVPHPERAATFEAFWPVYLYAHRKSVTRGFHYTGSLSAIVVLVLAGLIDLRLALLAPVVGYGCAWIGHFGFEKNRPAAFSQPIYSFLADWKMLWCFLTGRLRREFERHNIERI